MKRSFLRQDDKRECCSAFLLYEVEGLESIATTSMARTCYNKIDVLL